MDQPRDINDVKEDILQNYPRMKLEDKFNFACHAGLSCFNQCCGDVTIVLTAYDILRMKNALGMRSEDFHLKYTFVPFNKEQDVPVVILKMRDDDKKTCPFVSEKGCTIYENRPWACRMYPVGIASPAEGRENDDKFYFVMKDRLCNGLDEKKSWSIKEWIEDQGVEEYNKYGEMFKEVALHPRLVGGMELTPTKMDMYYMGLYNLDRFREFVFESTFLDKFDVSPEEIEAIKTDDLELMKFAFKWLKLSLFREMTMKAKDSYIEFMKKSKQPKNEMKS